MGLISQATDFLIGDSGQKDVSSAGTRNKYQNQALRELLQYLTGTPIDQVGTPYEGDRVAELTDTERAVQDQLATTVSGSGETFGKVTDALTGLLSADPTDFTDFFEKSIAAPLLQTFNEDILPGLTKTFGPTDFYGSDRQQATVKSTENVTDALTAELAKYGFLTRESALDRSLSAGTALGNLPGAQADALGKFASTSNIPRAVEQAKLDAEFEEFLRQDQEKQLRVRQLLAAIGIPTQENIVDVRQPSTGLLQSFLGTDAGSAGLAKLLSGLG